MREKIILALSNLGVDTSDFETNPVEDIDLQSYIVDSVMFISFIVELEEQLGFQIPDDFLVMESLTSLESYSEILEELSQGNNYPISKG